MHFDIHLLEQYNAVQKTFEKGDIIFKEGDFARYYYQIISGRVKMYNVNDQGKIFYQGIFGKDEALGEAPFFIEKKYPASAICDKKTTVIFINKEHFDQLINEHPDQTINLINSLCQKLIMKSTNTRNLILGNTEERIMEFLHKEKKKNNIKSEDEMLVKLTRQEIADFTGLRVETVIRTLKKMEEEGLVSIKNKKLYF